MKLTVEQAMEIRRTYEKEGPGGLGANGLALRYGVSHATIHRILTGEHTLVRGAPNISGARSAMETLTPDGWGSQTAEIGKQVRRVLSQPRRLTEREHRMKPCPKCAAVAGQYCMATNTLRAAYPKHLDKVHRERRK